MRSHIFINELLEESVRLNSENLIKGYINCLELIEKEVGLGKVIDSSYLKELKARIMLLKYEVTGG